MFEIESFTVKAQYYTIDKKLYVVTCGFYGKYEGVFIMHTPVYMFVNEIPADAKAVVSSNKSSLYIRKHPANMSLISKIKLLS